MLSGKKTYSLGSFKDEYSAMATYNVVALKLHGKFAYINTWNGPSIPGEPDPLAEELAKIPHRDLVPYPHDPSEKLIYIYKFPPHEKNVRKHPKSKTNPDPGDNRGKSHTNLDRNKRRRRR